MLYLRRTFELEHSIAEANVVLVGIPFSTTEIGLEVKHGPVFIREAIKTLPGYDEKLKINIFTKLKFCDAGDVDIVPGSWKLTEERIVDSIRWLLEQNERAFFVFLGGEHLITLGILKALKERYKKLALLHFDAHADLLKEYAGLKYSHITWAYYAAKLGVKIFQYGIRSTSAEEEKNARELKVSRNIEEASKFKGKFYLSVDLDVLDPSVASEVGTKEPLGITLSELFEVFKKIPMERVIAADIVECAAKSVNSNSANVAANIFKRIVELKLIRGGFEHAKS